MFVHHSILSTPPRFQLPQFSNWLTDVLLNSYSTVNFQINTLVERYSCGNYSRFRIFSCRVFLSWLRISSPIIRQMVLWGRRGLACNTLQRADQNQSTEWVAIILSKDPVYSVVTISQCRKGWLDTLPGVVLALIHHFDQKVYGSNLFLGWWWVTEVAPLWWLSVP